jgi:hypothetical protein
VRNTGGWQNDKKRSAREKKAICAERYSNVFDNTEDD